MVKTMVIYQNNYSFWTNLWLKNFDLLWKNYGTIEETMELWKNYITMEKTMIL